MKRRITNTVIIIFITLIAAVATLEVSYRFQLFDFYKAELRGLNSTEDLHSNKPKIMVNGDSFSAFPGSYVDMLQDSLPNYTIINTSVPGTGILQHALYLPRRINQFKPDVFIYQFYVGNDLFDITHPTYASSISFSRKAYWYLSDQLLSLSFLNFRFAGIRYQYYDDAGGSSQPKKEEIFSMDTYSKREKLNYQAEPGLIENSLFLKNGRENDWIIFTDKFRKLISKLPAGCQKYFVVIPQQAQISETMLENHRKMGASISGRIDTISSSKIPLYIGIESLCKELGIVLVDPLSTFRNEDKLTPLYYANDPHLNHRGDSLLANILFNQMRNKTIQP